MSIPSTRDDFKAYALRALGDGVTQINVSDEQLEDRIDEALFLFQQYHTDAVIKTYIQHEITSSTLIFAQPSTGQFVNGEAIHGATSNAFGFVDRATNTAMITFFTTSGSGDTLTEFERGRVAWIEGETVTGSSSQATGVIANSETINTAAITLGDYDNGWIPVDPSVIAVTKIFAPFDSRMSADILFDPQSQFNISLLSNFTSNSIIPYYIGRSYQQLLNDMFRGRPAIRFQRHMNRVYVDVNWYTTFRPHFFIIAEAYRTIDPDTYPLIWGDRWLQRYGIALFKLQWGMNLSKYNGIALPGGVTLDGRSILNDAKQECKDLEDQLKSEFQEPPMFIVG